MTTTTNQNNELLNQNGNRILELDIDGMTCASCFGRVGRKLGKIESVEASVNLPLESAHVTVPHHVDDCRRCHGSKFSFDSGEFIAFAPVREIVFIARFS